MSLVDSDHITPTHRGRHGAHYKMFPRKFDGKLVPGMIMFRDTRSNPYPKEERICQNCWRTPFSEETQICPRCGAKIEP